MSVDLSNSARLAKAKTDLAAAIALCESATRWIPPARSGHQWSMAYERAMSAVRAMDDAVQVLGD